MLLHVTLSRGVLMEFMTMDWLACYFESGSLDNEFIIFGLDVRWLFGWLGAQ